MKMKASLFSVSNENGEVLQVKITPSDDRQKAAEVYSSIWKLQESPITKFVCTDNIAVGKLFGQSVAFSSNPITDSSSVLQAFKNCFPTAREPKLLTDIYHAKMRVVKLMARSHPGTHSLSKQFSRL